MDCKSCGSNIPETAKFCPHCGAQVVAIEPELAAEESQVVESLPDNPCEPVGQDAPVYEVPQQSQQPASSYDESQQQYQTPPQPQAPFGAAPQQQQAPQAQAQPKQAYAKGCISAGLEDVRASEGWLKKSMFLGLVGCVPILSFVKAGYALNWAREVPFGGRTELPKSVVTGKNFEYGFYVLLITLVFSLVSGLIAGFLGWIPLLGWIAAVVASLGATMFVALGAFRMVMMQQLGEGFKVSTIWQAVKREWSSLLCAAFVPGLVAGLVVVVVLGLVTTIMTIAFAVPLAAVDSAGAYDLVGIIGVVGAMIFLFVFLVALYASAVISAFAELVTYRAVAHWVGRNVPEWVNEANQATYYNIPRY